MKTRFELEDRVDATIENMGTSLDNDDDGRATVISAITDVMDAMVGEKNISPDDIDSMEIFYLTYRYRFAPEEEEE